jgi:superfamily II DNA or RNA helicase
VIAGVTAEAPTLAAMATGAGKSLCWQLPAVPLRATTLVVAPRIALVTRALARPRDAVINDIARLREVGRCAVPQQRRGAIRMQSSQPFRRRAARLAWRPACGCSALASAPARASKSYRKAA